MNEMRIYLLHKPFDITPVDRRVELWVDVLINARPTCWLQQRFFLRKIS